MAFWPDVADAANEMVRRFVEAEQARKRRALEYARWSQAVATGEDPHVAGERLGINLQRVQVFILEQQQIGA